ncbi:uncharacterized protein METZ01_LOCUS223178, partial [marine metagenome]
FYDVTCCVDDLELAFHASSTMLSVAWAILVVAFPPVNSYRPFYSQRILLLRLLTLTRPL